MRPAVEPADRRARIDDRRAGQLCPVLAFGGAPVLRKSGRLVLGPPPLERRVGEQLEQVEPFEAHRRVGALVDVADAVGGHAVLAAEFFRFRLRTDRDETNAEPALRGVMAGLTQLRERFREKRSTDVPEPDDQGRKRAGERRDLGGNVVADARPV